MSNVTITPEKIAEQVYGKGKYITNAEMNEMLDWYNENRAQPVDMATFRDHMEQNGE